MVIADTDALIDFLRGTGLADKVEQAIAEQELATTAISVFELSVGARSARELDAITAILGCIKVLDIDRLISEQAAEKVRALRRKGITVGMADALIAATAIRWRLQLLTRNLKHFEHFTGLRFVE